MPSSSIRIARFALALLSCAATAAHAGIEPPVLRAALDSEPVTLDWNNYRSSTDRFLISFLMRGLLKYDAGDRPVCDLCKSYSVSADGKKLEFELRGDEVWSDGVKLEAQQFVDSFRRLLDPANAFKAADEFKAIEGAEQPGPARKWDPKKLAVRAESKERLVIQLGKPLVVFPHLLTTVAAFPIRKELLKGPKDSGETHASTAVLGPYQLAAWERGKRVVIEGNPHFTGLRPVYRVDFVLGQHAQLLAKFKAGRLDLLSGPTTEDLLKVPGQNLQVSPYWATRNLILNSQRQPVSEKGLRKAMLDALERDQLPAVIKNGERQVTGLIPPGLTGYRELPLVTPDAARADAERARAVPLTKALDLVLLARDTESDRRVAQWVGEQLARIQIRLTVRAKPSAAYYNDLEAGNFDLALTTWAFAMASPLEILDSFRTDSAKNRGHWTNVAFDALLGQAFLEQKPTEFASLVDRLTQIVETQDVGVIPLGYPTQPFLLGRRVVSFAITPYGDPDLVRIQLKQ